MALPSWFTSTFRSRTTTYRDVELLFLFHVPDAAKAA